MSSVTIKVLLECDIQQVWDKVVGIEHYEWRSDISKVEVIEKNHFIEYTKEGFATHFFVEDVQPLKRWCFRMENDNMKGFWVGEFETIGKNTQITLVEEVEAKKGYMKPFVKMFLKKQQALFVEDLKKALLLKS